MYQEQKIIYKKILVHILNSNIQVHWIKELKMLLLFRHFYDAFIFIFFYLQFFKTKKTKQNRFKIISTLQFIGVLSQIFFTSCYTPSCILSSFIIYSYVCAYGVPSMSRCNCANIILQMALIHKALKAHKTHRI